MKRILPALAAVSGACGFAASPAAALELGEIMVESKLGQPLRASIAYALQPDEQVGAFCIFLKPGVTAGGLQRVSKAQVSLANNTIHLRSAIPIREPMLSLQLAVDCPYTAKLQREYTMFFYPGVPQDNAVASVAVTAPSVSETASSGSARSTARSTARPAVADTSPISVSNRYQVQPGDSLSSIIARIDDRPRGLWPAVNAVFAANPEAFIDGDINLLKAGSWLEIPDLYQTLGAQRTGTAAVTAVSVKLPAPTAVETYNGVAVETRVAQDGFDSGYAGATPESTGTDLPAVVGESESTGSSDSSAAASPRPGDVILGNDSPFVSPIESETAAAAGASATADFGPETAIANSPRNAAAMPGDPQGAANESWSLLAWLGGAGLAVFLGLLLFGRRVRERFGSTPVGIASGSGQRQRYSEPERRVSPPPDVDFAFDLVDGDAPSMLLDADLGLGTGFRDTSDLDVAQDFGFSTSDDFADEFDLDLTAAATSEHEDNPTDVIPPHLNIKQSILESEIPPSDDDDEYDLSMIVDATRQPIVDTRLTAKDLKAVQVDSADDDTEEYTLNREVDYKILEQDYQEEFTTTQALNEEIARAALELAQTMGRRIDEDDALDATAEMPLKSVDSSNVSAVTESLAARTEPEITAELATNLLRSGEAVNDDLIGGLDDTGVNEELTAELPHSDNDATAEMDIEGGRIDTKKTRAS
jgi:hypothetical protein